MRRHLDSPRRTSPLLDARARGMREASTGGERLLWEELRAGKLGARFRRQYPLLGRFVADFYAPSARLVVEVDGAWHAQRTAADARRDRALARAGHRVLRLPDALVREHIEDAVARVRAALAARW